MFDSRKEVLTRGEAEKAAINVLLDMMIQSIDGEEKVFFVLPKKLNDVIDSASKLLDGVTSRENDEKIEYACRACDLLDEMIARCNGFFSEND